jgi:7-cyano-7-deazaguanine synthase
LGLAAEAADSGEIRALRFHYGQKQSEQEAIAAEAIAKYYGVLLVTADMSGVMALATTPMLTGRGEIPRGVYSADSANSDSGRVSTYVPYRNGVMLSIAAAYADSVWQGEFVEIMYGAHEGVYPDCSAEFVRAQSDAIRTGTYGKITVTAPFVAMTKADVVRKGLTLTKLTPFALTYSCYAGGESHCGECATCIERLDALKQGGVAWTE